MKLRYKIFGLLVVPVVCQLASVLVLFQSMVAVDRAAVQEARAKEIIAITQELDGLLGSTVLELTGKTFGGTSETVDGGLEKIASRLDRLQQLTRSDPAAAAVSNRLSGEVRRFIENWKDLANSWTPGQDKLFFAQFLSKEELVSSTKVLYRNMRRDVLALSNIYKPMAIELRPQALQSRSRLRDTIFLAVQVSLGIALVSAFFVQENIVRRLKFLMTNIAAFSRGEKSMHELSGNDELTRLDEAFRSMSAERWRLEDIQKSLRAMVSHDLRSPLTAMSLSLDMLLDTDRYPSTDPAITKVLRRLRSETKRLSQLARTLLDIEKLEGGHIAVDCTPVECSVLVELSAGILASIADRKQISIETQLEEGLVLHCDRERTIQALVNLISNALKFSPPKSSVVVRSSLIADNRAKLEVIDCGPGVPDDQASSLFNKFTQLDQPESIKSEGSGLGLYICRLLVEAQGGTVGYTKPEVRGACFWIALPISEGDGQLEIG